MIYSNDSSLKTANFGHFKVLIGKVMYFASVREG